MEIKPLNHKIFKEKLKDPSSYKIKDQLLQYVTNSFLNSLSDDMTTIEKKIKIHNFTMLFEETLPKYQCWRSAKYSEIEEASEVLENIITREKYSILFGTDKFALEHDESLIRSYSVLDFIEPRHLDINPNLAQENLIQVAEIIINAHHGNNSHGADDSLPLFVYVLLKAKVEKLFSNFSFIKNYRYKPRREYRDPVEFKYTFTSLKIALRFILEIKSNKLHLMPNEDFREMVKIGKKKNAETQTSLEDKVMREVELYEMFKGNYNGEVSVEYFKENPQDLKNFIADYYALLNFTKINK